MIGDLTMDDQRYFVGDEHDYEDDREYDDPEDVEVSEEDYDSRRRVA